MTTPTEEDEEAAAPVVELTEAQEARLLAFDWLIEECDREIERRRALAKKEA